MKVYISVDMEGIAGVSHPRPTERGDQGYPAAAALMVGEANAAIEGALVAARHEWKNPLLLNRHSLVFLVLSGLATGLSWLCYYRALQTGPASLVAPIDKLSLVFAIVLSVLFLGERLGVYQWLGATMIAAGALVIIFK